MVIDGVRATSRQLALKEKEVERKMRGQSQQPEAMFKTPKKQRKAKGSSEENPQAGADKAPARKTEHLPESSPKIIKEQLIKSFSNKDGDREDQMDWAVFTRCQQLLSRVCAKSTELELKEVAEKLNSLERSFKVRERKFESGQ